MKRKQMNYSQLRFANLLMLSSLALFVTTCARNPVTGSRQVVLISEAQEIGMGGDTHPMVLAQFGRLEHPELQQFFGDLGQRMARDSHRPDLPWTFTIVDDPIVNAFAVPGGYVYFTRGILAYMNTEAELAGVLGHEIGHVTARHSVSQISRAQLFGIGLGVGSILSPTFGQLSELAQAGVGLLFLKYSRSDEEQADELGIEYMHQQGYDPRQLSEFFAVFQRLGEESGRTLPGWLSSHPSPPDRIRDTRALAEDYLSRNPGRQLNVGRESFLRRLDGIVFGENPREGFVDGNRFLHPDLRFQFGFPSNWRVQNSKRSVIVMQPNGAAALQLTLAPEDAGLSPDARAQQLGRQQGVRLLDGRRATLHGNPAYLALYEVQAAQGQVLRAMVGFIRHRNHLYELAGLSPAQAYRQYSGALEQSITSFRELTDSRALQVQPDHLRIYQVQQGGTLRDVAARYDNPRAGADELAALNRIDPDERLPAGAVVKTVEAGRRY